MPRYQVNQIRSYMSAVLIDAADPDAAKRGDGDVIDKSETDSWADSDSIVQVEDHVTEVSL